MIILWILMYIIFGLVHAYWFEKISNETRSIWVVLFWPLFIIGLIVGYIESSGK